MKESKEDGKKPGFFWDLLNSFNPFYYHNVADRDLWPSFKHLFKVLAFCFLVMLIMFIPFFVTLPNTLYQELQKFDEFSIGGNLSMTESIELPESNPKVIIDTTGATTEMENEKVLVTKDYIYFKHFRSTKRINFDKLMDVAGHKKEYVWMLISFLALIIPSLLFYAYMIFLLKYLLIMLVITLLFYFVERVLLLYKVSFKRVFNTVMFAVAPMALLEIALLAFDTSYLIPLASFLGVELYLVSTLIYLLLSVFAVVIVEKKVHLFGKKDE